MSPQNPFAGGDQAYLRDEQYQDASRLQRRANIHVRYGTAAVPWFLWITERLDLRPGYRVLEVGCGPGWLWTASGVRHPADLELVLTDLSAGMVEEAKARVSARAMLGSVEARTADLMALPFDDDSFDRVIANHMLYHLPDPAVGVAELARVLRPDGLLVAATNGRGAMQPLWAIRSEVLGVPAVDATVEAFGKESGRPLLERRFAMVAWEQYDDELHCTEVDDLMAYVTSTPPGEGATDEQLADLRARLDAAVTSGGGVLRVAKDSGCFMCRRPRAAR